jgi:RNA polymerase sigma-70 factor (family 1)
LSEQKLHIVPPQSSSEAELLLRTAKGDDKAYRLLFDEYQPLLLSFVFRITRNMVETEEIVQDIFLKLWMSKETLSEVKNFKNYLFILSRNAALNSIDKEMRRQRNQQAFEKSKVGIAKEEPDGEDPNRPYHLIDEAIQRLPGQQQSAWLLSRHEGLTYEQIAEKMGISAKTVKRHIRTATDSMKDYISTHNMQLVILLVTVNYL